MPNGMFVKKVIKKALVAGADSGTLTIDLPRANYLASLMVRGKNTNGSTSNTAETLESVVTKIEVEADGVVIFSMTGYLARLFEHFDIGKLPAYDESQSANAVQFAEFPIKFGRHQSDKEIILPAHRFASLQLKITYACTDSATVGWATSESNLKFDVVASYLVSKELINTPFFKKINVFSHTTTAVTDDEVDLPTGAGAGAYRRIMIGAYEAGIQDGVDCTEYELLVNGSQRVVHDLWDTSQDEDYQRYKARGGKQFIAYLSAATTTVTFKVSRINQVAVTGATDDKTFTYDSIAGDQVVFDTESSSASDGSVKVEGNGVSYATMIDLGTDNINDSLDVTAGSGISSLKLKLVTGAAGADNRVVTEQLVKF